MMHRYGTKMVFAGLVLFYLVCFIGMNRELDPAHGGRPVLYSDGIGHYDYLPRLFLHHHLQYTFKDNLFAAANEEGHYVNRFFCGTAVLQSPFFAGGVLYASLAGYRLDGYSAPFQYAIGLSAVFYALWGLYLLYRLLTRFMGIGKHNALWTVVFTASGTNLIFYTTWMGSFSHVFSFFAITAFLYRVAIAIQNVRARNIFVAVLLLGLVIITRPVNLLVVLLLPALFQNKKDFYAACKNILRWRYLPFMLLGFFIPVFIQCVAWYLQTGHWFVFSYRQEGFVFFHPQIKQVLFGFRRGLFIYCPLLLLCLLGIPAGLKINRWKTVWLLLFLVMFTYVTASWWHWTYGDTFGIRPFNDILVAWMILFAFALTRYVRFKKTMITMAVLFSLLNLVYSWQFAAGILSVPNMTSDKFFSLFLKTAEKYKDVYGGSDDLPPFAPHGFKTLQTLELNFDDRPGGILHVNGEEFLQGAQFVFQPAERLARHLWIELTYKRKLLYPGAMREVLFVYHVLDNHTDSTLFYSATRVKEYPREKAGEWQTVSFRLWLPDVIVAGAQGNYYLWNKGKEEFYLDDYSLRIQTPR